MFCSERRAASKGAVPERPTTHRNDAKRAAARHIEWCDAAMLLAIGRKVFGVLFVRSEDTSPTSALPLSARAAPSTEASQRDGSDPHPPSVAASAVAFSTTPLLKSASKSGRAVCQNLFGTRKEHLPPPPPRLTPVPFVLLPPSNASPPPTENVSFTSTASLLLLSP